MCDVTLIYLRNSIRLLGLGMFLLGLGLGLYQFGSLFYIGTAPEFALHGLVPVPSWLHYASPLVQSLCGWPWVVLEIVPFPLACMGGGMLAVRV